MKQIFFTIILALSFYIPAFPQNENSLCPKIEVIGGGVVQSGEPMNFSVKISNETKITNLEYEWKISVGTIASGQETDSIIVDTAGLSGQNIEAEIKVKGLSANCANTASEIGSVAPVINRDPLDSFGRLPNDEVKARIYALFITLGSEPNSKGYVINYGTDKEIVMRESQIRKAIIYLKLDLKRVEIVRGGISSNEGVWTVVWVVPPGADNPQP